MAVTCISCGAMMMIEPSGSLLLLDLHWLKNSSFHNFTIPGLILTVTGVVHFFSWHFIKMNKPVGMWLAVAAGLLMIGYEVVQMILLQMTYWLQYIYIVLGFFIVLMALQLKHKELI